MLQIKLFFVLLALLSISSCEKKATEMITPKDAAAKFSEFIAKEKFVQATNYPGIADEKMRPIYNVLLNKVATDFKNVSESEKPTDLMYQEKIKIGLLQFAPHYLDLDTEDREQVCSYFEELMDIVALENSDGQLNNFMYGFDPK